jgi:tetratricopeptide (TPR) repeat protein
VAQAMYERCLEDDPDFAPAWARLGRTHRVIGKYLDADSTAAYDAAERSFRRALSLNPDLPLAHSLYTYLETELGRGQEAMVRLLDRLRQHSADAELFAALVHSCRYCGLLDASLAAHEQARRLDPQVRTSIPHTWFAMGEYERCLDESVRLTDPLTTMVLVTLGRLDEARTTIQMECERFASNPILRTFVSHQLAFTGGSRDDALRDIERLAGRGFRDGEGLYYVVRSLARLGEIDWALATLGNVVADGFYCYPAFVRDPWLDPLRTLPAFNELLRTAEAHHRAAARAFVEHGGARLLGVHPPA